MPPVDPCSAKTPFSVPRFLLFSLLLLTACPGGVLLFIFLGNRPFGFQLASVVVYTAVIVLLTFSHYRDQQRYLFTCPVGLSGQTGVGLWKKQTSLRIESEFSLASIRDEFFAGPSL